MRLTPAALSAALVALAVACHPHTETAATPAQTPDSISLEQAYRDSVARAEQLARERAEAERQEALRIADSIENQRRSQQQMVALLTTMIHFDYDRASVRPSDAQILDLKVPVLQANPDVRIQVAGNCDERGSDEYNLALGNRRAIAAKAYLARYGISGDRIETVTYGEERPVDPRHNETAWAMNRNSQFSLLTPTVALRTP